MILYYCCQYCKKVKKIKKDLTIKSFFVILPSSLVIDIGKKE